MVTVFTKEYLKRHSVVDTQFKDKKKRDKLARELRKMGWKVETEKFSFQDLGGEDTFTIFATKSKLKKVI